jgi:hypothetical protein
MKFIVGDKVKIIKNEDRYYSSKMEQFIGKTCTLKYVYENCCCIEEDNGMWVWDFNMLEPVQDNKFNYWRNICEIQAEQTAKGIAKYGYPLEQNTWLDINERMRYLQEELVDVLMYVEHIKTLLGNESKKQDAKKVITNNFKNFDCPNCKISMDSKAHKANYCANCGQKLDWRR